MSQDGYVVAILSGDLSVDERITVLDRFRTGNEKVLVTTNVLARGKFIHNSNHLFLLVFFYIFGSSITLLYYYLFFIELFELIDDCFVGIDVAAVTMVVNFDLPTDLNRKADYETYLHRIGRTGRFGMPGIAINLIDSEEMMNVCRDIERHFGKQIALLDTENEEEVEKIGEK